MSGQEQLAYDLYAASFSESSPDAKFVTLMMAVETLINPSPRRDEARAHVNALIAATQKSGLRKPEIDSMLGSLRWLRNESITQAGKKLASQLGDRSYMEATAPKFFTKCYSLRSALLHGHEPRPSRDDVGAYAASLSHFVADLLSLEIT